MLKKLGVAGARLQSVCCSRNAVKSWEAIKALNEEPSPTRGRPLTCLACGWRAVQRMPSRLNADGWRFPRKTRRPGPRRRAGARGVVCKGPTCATDYVASQFAVAKLFHGSDDYIMRRYPSIPRHNR